MRNIFIYLVISFLISFIAFIGCWSFLVLHYFQVPEPIWLSLSIGLLNIFSNHQFWWVNIFSFVAAVLSLIVFSKLVDDWSGSNERVLRGTQPVTGKQLAKLTRTKGRKAPAQVEIASVPIPINCESNHLLVAGSTNTGKSTVIDELVTTALERDDRFIFVDPNGHLLSRFSKKGDVLLNPFDKRSPGWCLFNEIRKPYDFERLSSSVIPNSADASTQQWHGYAQQLLAETMRSMAQNGEIVTERLLYWLTKAPAKELASYLAGSAAGGLFEPGAERAFASTRFILNYHIGPYQHLQPGDFSLRGWLESGRGNLYLTWREDMLSSLKPLITSWVDILISSVLTLPTDSPRPLWFMLDELASLERLTSLEAALTKGRKHGLRVVAGLQSVSQLDSIYGHDHANTLRSSFRNMLALGCSNADPDTAEAMSNGLGQNEIARVQTTINNGHNISTISKTTQQSMKTLVLPSQLMNLPPLKGYLKFAGDYPVASIFLQRVDYKAHTPDFVER